MRREPQAVARRLGEPDRQFQFDDAVAHRELAPDDVPIAGSDQPIRRESDLRIALDIEEVAIPQVPVANPHPSGERPGRNHELAGKEAARVDLHRAGGLERRIRSSGTSPQNPRAEKVTDDSAALTRHDAGTVTRGYDSSCRNGARCATCIAFTTPSRAPVWRHSPSTR